MGERKTGRVPGPSGRGPTGGEVGEGLGTGVNDTAGVCGFPRGTGQVLSPSVVEGSVWDPSYLGVGIGICLVTR